MRIALVVVLALCGIAHAATRETVSQAVYRGSSVVERPATVEACKARAAELEETAGTTATLTCRVSYTYTKTTTTTPPPEPPAETWTQCATENQRCAFEGTKTVRYGAGSTWISQQHTGGVDCSNRVFTDPAPGTVKRCETSSIAPTPVPPTPQPEPPPTATGTARLTWQAPTTNTDNSPLTDLAGFQIVYGRSSTELSQQATITSPSVTTYVVEGLAAGTWYFAVRAFSAGGNVSANSSIESKTIQ